MPGHWVVAAEGTSLETLSPKISDMELKKGTPVKWVMDFKVPGVAWNFDMWGAEMVFQPFIPSGMELIDVYEEGGKGIVEMEVDPPMWLFAIIGFVARHWLAIVIAGFALALVISLIKMLVWLEEYFGPDLTKFIIGAAVVGGIGLVAYALLKRVAPERGG